jgi:hypothetical protein
VSAPSPLSSVTMLKDGSTLLAGGADGMVGGIGGECGLVVLMGANRRRIWGNGGQGVGWKRESGGTRGRERKLKRNGRVGDKRKGKGGGEVCHCLAGTFEMALQHAYL